MFRLRAALISSLLVVYPGLARQIQVICGTSPERRKEELHLHRQAVLARRASRLQSAGAPAGAPASTNVDYGNVAVIEDSDGVVAQRNPFNLDLKTLTFPPAAAGATLYTFQTSADSYDAAAASQGTAIRLGDDDSHQLSLPFAFPFFGKTYQSIFINSDGNLTFSEGDNASTDRSLGRMVAGPPRIAGLFADLDPSKTPAGVTVTSSATRFIVSWSRVPQYSSFGIGTLATFQIRLYPDGRIQVAYDGISVSGAVVGIAPGDFQGWSTVVSFAAGSSAQYSSTVAERFGGASEIDIETATQKFYATHDDAYDYIAFFNNEGIPSGPGSVAWEQTLRNNRSGYGDFPVNDAPEYGSPSRLQAVLNLGPLNQYPASPADLLPARAASGYNSLKLLGHEVGHLFLAYASVRDPNNPGARPMLGIQLAHWAFNFDAEASFMEGNRIQDNGPSASPRYIITATVDQYAPLDQYLMGFRAASDVPDIFLVTGNPPTFSVMFPQVGIQFNGARQNVQVNDIIQVEGRRTPDYTVAQRHFRMAFVLIVPAGTTPQATDIAQIENMRAQFEPFYAQAAGGRAQMDAALRHALSLSLAPAAGNVTGSTISATVSIQRPAASPLVITLASQSNISVPPSVTIPAGAASVSFPVAGLAEGVSDLSAAPSDNTYETAYARVQVLSLSSLTLSTVSGNDQVAEADGTLSQPIVVRATDINNLPYPGVQVRAVSSSGGIVTPQMAVTDANGQAAFQWTPGLGSGSGSQIGELQGPPQLQLSIAGSPAAPPVAITALPPTGINPAGVVNAASFAPGTAPGALSTIYGTTLAGGVTAAGSLPWPTNLGGVQVLLNNEPAQLLYVSDQQINFLAPSDLAPGTATLTVLTGAGTSASAHVAVNSVSPGIFYDIHSNFGAILSAASLDPSRPQAVAPGQYIEIYCTGLGPVQQNSDGLMATTSPPQVLIANIPATVIFSGLTPLYGGGLYQVDVQIPSNTPSGAQPLSLTMNGSTSNTVKVAIQ